MGDFNNLLYVGFIILGALLVIYGIFSYKRDKNRLLIKRCTKTTQARITGFDATDKIIKTRRQTVYRNNGTYYRKKRTAYYTPYIEFEDENGAKIELLYKRPLEKRLSNNQKITVRYNPLNPYECILSGDKHVQIFSTQAILIGGLLITAGIFLTVQGHF